MNLRILTTKNLSSPKDINEGWEPLDIGFSMTEARIMTWATVVCFILINTILFFSLKENLLADLKQLFDTFGKPLGLALTLFSLVLYMMIHESIHYIFFKLKDTDKSVHIALLGLNPCIIFNGKLSKQNMIIGCLMPLIVLTIPLACLALMQPGFLTTNLLFIHLSGCIGDIVLSIKVSKQKDVTHLWSVGTGCYVLKG